MAAHYKSRKPASTFGNHLSDTVCAFVFSFEALQTPSRIQIALKTMNASPPLRRVWWGQLLAAILVSAMTQWSSAPSEKDEGLSRAC